MAFLKKRYLLFIYLLVASLSNAQDRIDSAINALGENYPQEKVYIAYQKSSYLAGEKIWLKAFVFSGYNLSDISTNLFMEMYNANKTLVGKKTFPLFNGIAEGSLSIPDTASEGIYYIRAYTNWMLNFNEDFQYIHSVPVYNPLSKWKLIPAQIPWKASAFVEGGTLLLNKASTIVIRLGSPAELPAKWHGYVFDSIYPAQKIISFESIDKNIGSFNLIPHAGINYKVWLEDEQGESKIISLPPVETKGISFSIKQEDTILEYKIHFSNVPLGETYKIIGTVDNNIVYKATLRNIDSLFIHSFSTGQMTKGVLQLTLFDNAYHVVAERLCFLHPDNSRLPVITDSLVISDKPRAVNEFGIRIDTGKNYAIMVFDEKAENPISHNNILSSFWFSSDFPGTIADPEMYFMNTDPDAKKALDMIFITEKWRRFSWTDILNNRFPIIKYAMDNYLSYEGTSYYKGKFLPNASLNMILFLPDSSRQLVQVRTNKDGKFLMQGLAFYGNTRINYQPASKRIDKEELRVDFMPLNKYVPYKKSLPSSGYQLVIKKANEPVPDQIVKAVEDFKNEKIAFEKVHPLADVTVKTNKKSATQLLDEKLSSNEFYNPRETIYDFINVQQLGTEGMNLLYWLEPRIPGGIKTASFYINELKVNRDMVSLTSTNEVAMVKIQGTGSMHTVLIYMKTGMEMLNQGRSANTSVLKGYECEENYLMPDYSNPDLQSIKTDHRDLLFWDNIFTPNSASQKIKIRFYNNDNAQKFKAVILCIPNEGFPLYHEGILK